MKPFSHKSLSELMYLHIDLGMPYVYIPHFVHRVNVMLEQFQGILNATEYKDFLVLHNVWGRLIYGFVGQVST